MLNLADVKTRKSTKPRILTVYGRPGVGKTTFGASFPDAVFIQTEEGEGDLEIASFTPEDCFRDYTSIISALAQLYNDPHHFKTLVMDSINHLEPLLFAFICQKNNVSSIEAIPYGKGYTFAEEEFQNFWTWLETLRAQRNMNVVLLGHPEALTAPDPHLDEHKRFQLKMHKKMAAYVVERSDAVMLLDRLTIVAKGEEVMGKTMAGRAKSSGQRVLYTDGGASFEAKTRFKAPEQLMIPEVGGYDILAPYLPGQDTLGQIAPHHPLAAAAAAAAQPAA
ncbi:MAG: ATP-binding protein [Paracoccaceae bacterium]